MRKTFKKSIAALLALMMASAPLANGFAAAGQTAAGTQIAADVQTDTALRDRVSASVQVLGDLFAGTKDPWKAMDMAYAGRGAEVDFDGFAGDMLELIQKEDAYPTDLHKAAITLTCMGADATALPVSGTAQLNLIDKITRDERQLDIYALTYALLAVDSGSYAIADDALWTRERLIGEIVSLSKANGGWSWDPTSTDADEDTTAMVISALAPYCDTQTEAAEAVNRAVAYLQGVQKDSGCFGYGDNGNANTTAVVILAAAAIGQDAAETFKKTVGDKTVDAVTGLYLFETAEHRFGYDNNQMPNDFAEEQIFRALLAYQKYLEKGGAQSPYVYDSTTGSNEVTKDALLAKIAAVENTEQGDYTGESWKAFQDALSAAKQTAADENTSADQLRDVMLKLIAAYKGLAVGGTEEEQKLTVSFLLTGDKDAVWIEKSDWIMKNGDSVMDVFTKVLTEKNLKWEDKNGYISGVQIPGTEEYLREFDRGKNSGWKYRVNGKNPNVGLSACLVADTDQIEFYYIEDYKKEDISFGGGSSGGSGSGSGSKETTAAEKAELLIVGIGQVTKDSGDKLAAARSAYDALIDTQKQQVGNYAILTAAEAAYAALLKEENHNKPEENPVQPLPFGDVEKHWAKDVIAAAYEKGYMTGISETEFAPDESLSRAMLVTVLYRMQGEPETDAKTGFTDVSAGAWYEKAVAWAYETGIVKGYTENTFAPDDVITREQLAAVMYRLAGEPETIGMVLREFDDKGLISDYAKTAMLWAFGKGIITGKNELLLDPDGNTTRAEAAAILERYQEATA